MTEVRRPAEFAVECGRVREITGGESGQRDRVLIVRVDEGDAFTVGDAYGTHGGRVRRVIYAPRRWWAFWKRKVPLMYEIGFE